MQTPGGLVIDNHAYANAMNNDVNNVLKMLHDLDTKLPSNSDHSRFKLRGHHEPTIPKAYTVLRPV